MEPNAPLQQTSPMPQTAPSPQPASKNRVLTGLSIVILLLTGSSLYLGYQNFQLKKQIAALTTPKPIPNTSPSPTYLNTTTSTASAKFIYHIGNFLYSPPSDYIYESDMRGVKFEVEHSDATKYNETNGPCYRISNVDLFSAIRQIPTLTQNASPSISIVSWNSNELNYKDAASKAQFQTWAKQLLHLNTYTNISLLEKAVFNPDYGKPLHNEPNIDVGQFLYCSGIYSYPLTIEKVDSNDFTQVFFINVLEGNGVFSTPAKALVVNHNNDWLIFKEQSVDRSNDYLASCHKPTTLESLVCADKLWKEKYRNVSDEQTWVNQTLSSLKLVN